ncbi:MAG: hypothetical protein SF029_24485 [bacterium]|nr:hypothetical protein [bacterium]
MNAPMNAPMTTPFTERGVLLLRVGLFGAAVVLLSMAVDLRDTIPTGGGFLTYLVPGAVLLLGIGLLALCLLPTLRGWMRWWVLVGLLSALGGYACIQATLYSPLYWTRTDNEMIGEYAVEALRAGMNPYLWDYTDMTRVFRDRGNRTTQFLDNSTQRRVTYPAFPTLLLAAFDSAGVGQARVMTFAFLGGLMVLMFVGAPPDFRPVVLLPLFIQKDFIVLSLIGAQDVVWSALLVAMLLAWKRPLWRAVLFGLAVNFRQQPWFIAPFLLLILWHEGGTIRDRVRRMAVFTGIAAGLFVAFNLPFFLANPREWVLSAFEPSYARFNVFSQGLAALSQYGVVSLTREYYTLLHLGLYACLLWIGLRHPRALGQAFWLLPAVFFWVYYRGLGNYWLYWMPPLLMGVLVWTRNAAPQALTPAPSPSGRGEKEGQRGEMDVKGSSVGARHASPLQLPSSGWRTTAFVCGAFAQAMILLALLPAFHSDRIQAEVIAPIELTVIGDPLVERLHVRVTNTGEAAFRPRFSVQYERVTETYPWTIEVGPEWLAGGESAEYVITSGGVRGKMFTPERGAQVVVSDAGLDNRWRTVATVPAPEDMPNAFRRPGESAPPEQIHNAAQSEDRVRDLLDDPTAYYLALAERYTALGEVDAAREAYAQALALDPHNRRAIAGFAALGDAR